MAIHGFGMLPALFTSHALKDETGGTQFFLRGRRCADPIHPNGSRADDTVSLLDGLKNDMRGVHYAMSLFVATTILWIVVKEIGDANPIWAISSMVATSDPQIRQALQTFRGRIINTLLGCAIGLLFV